MRKVTALLILCFFMLCSLSACSQRTYEDGYDDGYRVGYSDAEFEMGYLAEEEFQDGYDIGYDDGYWDGSKDGWIDHIEEPGRFLEYEAAHYAREQTGWNPEEAWMIIDAYQNREPLWADGATPSYEEYLEAIDTLIYFYEYFYGSHYE